MKRPALTSQSLMVLSALSDARSTARKRLVALRNECLQFLTNTLNCLLEYLAHRIEIALHNSA
jgi:hypothetical protein